MGMLRMSTKAEKAKTVASTGFIIFIAAVLLTGISILPLMQKAGQADTV